MKLFSDSITTPTRPATLVLLTAAALLSISLTAHAKDNVDGTLHVECWKEGKVALTMDRKPKTNQWTEKNGNGAVDDRWRTASKDQWSFYLTKPGVKLQLDLHLNKCTWDSGGQPLVYNVRNAS
jgi:hypothetical protein